MAKKLYVGNLDFGIDDQKLKEIFSQFGNIEEATVIQDKFSKRSKGFGFVTFSEDADADKAVSEMDQKEVEGRAIKVNEARPKEDNPKRNFNGPRGGQGNRSRFGERKNFQRRE